jgi:hypothetical protein
MSKKKDVADNLTLPVKSEFLLYQTGYLEKKK